ncbi:hypothetical protein FBZ99_103318 [Rhizobium sp. ERR 1071]|nr:hypothetical protein FBZ99_103318 [Rhizobium sp. ERR1071]
MSEWIEQSRFPLLPSGRRWPEGSDEGGSGLTRAIRTLALRILVTSFLGPLIRPVGHLLPAGEKGRIAPCL